MVLNTLRLTTLSLLFVLFISQMSYVHASTEQASLGGDMPNVIFIWIDTLRADSLGVYGYERDTSPNFDLLAKDSTLFMNHFTPHTVTLSSFMSIITGLYPFSHGVLHIAKDKLSPKIKTLAEVLNMYGYQTSWFGPDDPHLDPEVGFGRGFDYLNIFDTELAVGRSTVLQTMERNKNKKFFINFHSYHVHSPYIPSGKYKYSFTSPKNLGILESSDEIHEATVEAIRRGVYRNKKFPGKIVGASLRQELEDADLYDPNPKIAAKQVEEYLLKKNYGHKYADIYNRVYEYGISPNNKESLEYAKALYDAEILEFDTEIIGPVIDKLRELHLYEDTMIVICSDHGEEFGEHGKVGHGKSLHDEVTRVPLLIKAPGPGKELQIEQMSQTVDIMPTILSLLGIPYPHQVQGIDFSPLIKKTGSFTPREYVYGQMPYFKSIQNSEWKLHIFRGYHSFSWLSENVELFLFGKKQFFNMLKDPGETKDLYSKEPKVRDRLETLLSDWELNLPRYQDTTYSFQPHLDEKTKEKIKKTGYW